jgi:hypothetical protein
VRFRPKQNACEVRKLRRKGYRYLAGYSEDLSQCPSYTCSPPEGQVFSAYTTNDRNQPKSKNTK